MALVSLFLTSSSGELCLAWTGEALALTLTMSVICAWQSRAWVGIAFNNLLGFNDTPVLCVDWNLLPSYVEIFDTSNKVLLTTLYTTNPQDRRNVQSPEWSGCSASDFPAAPIQFQQAILVVPFCFDMMPLTRNDLGICFQMNCSSSKIELEHNIAILDGNLDEVSVTICTIHHLVQITAMQKDTIRREWFKWHFDL